MTNPEWIDKHLAEIMKYQKQLDYLPYDGMEIARIEILSKILVFIGKLSGEFSEQYKRIYATRKRVHAEAYLAATKSKTQMAELAVIDLREEEAVAYGNMKRWNNAFESTREEINALKYKVRISLEDGSSRR
ncbi:MULTISPECIES: hypothetical protein [Peribacillus]|uniref:hypothetical protein n=1 Tax=Peribacillus TaxID=2675229 RepID=UPI001F4D676F|nr:MULTISPECIES: hypothetical protein [unclassified Peribacillus]MCK1982214.1 hypothetical protein [Peribacillus sp. Aquil_B1]MCK2007434.1 hypothetical protein [Peribacillus sp. Aquil_B8]